jgi:hypothetical protein
LLLAKPIKFFRGPIAFAGNDTQTSRCNSCFSKILSKFVPGFRHKEAFQDVINIPHQFSQPNVKHFHRQRTLPKFIKIAPRRNL